MTHRRLFRMKILMQLLMGTSFVILLYVENKKIISKIAKYFRINVGYP